jgi:hypothetical protein
LAGSQEVEGGWMKLRMMIKIRIKVRMMRC